MKIYKEKRMCYFSSEHLNLVTRELKSSGENLVTAKHPLSNHMVITTPDQLNKGAQMCVVCIPSTTKFFMQVDRDLRRNFGIEDDQISRIEVTFYEKPPEDSDFRDVFVYQDTDGSISLICMPEGIAMTSQQFLDVPDELSINPQIDSKEYHVETFGSVTVTPNGVRLDETVRLW